MLQKYNKQKENFLAIYDMLEENKSSFIDSKLKISLNEKKESLLKDQFILAVAGQMKSGKSTLLNALIFGDDILPADDTELTAKITFIIYGEKPSFEAVLYTQSELDELRNSVRGTDGEAEFNDHLNKSLESLQNQGYSNYEEILLKKVITGEDFKDLINFVGKNGIYTPFVNTLTLRTNSDWVKNIIVVDTPGMNSPNKLRDRVVKDWIVKADAVVYCSYAGRAMDSSDLKFVKDYMLHISSKHRLFALTKSDLINGEDKLMNAIGDMINEDWNLKYDLIPSKNVVFPVSQMAVLLDKMDKSGATFTTRMEEDYELMESKNANFDHYIKQFSSLENGIEKKLIANKESNILETHRQYLDTIFSESYLKLKENLDSCSKSLDLVNSDKDQLNITEQKIKDDIKNISETLLSIQYKIENKFEDSFQKIKIKEEFNNSIVSIIRELEGKTLDELGLKGSIIIEKKLSECIDKLKIKTKSFSSEFSTGMQRIFDNNIFKLEYLNTELINDRIELECNSYIESKVNVIIHKLAETSRLLKKNYSDSLTGWRKFKDFWKSKKRVNEERGEDALKTFIEKAIDPISSKFDSLEQIFRTELSTTVQTLIKEIEHKNQTLLEEKKVEVNNLRIIQGSEIETRRETYQKEFAEFVKQQKKLEALMEEIKNKLNFTE